MEWKRRPTRPVRVGGLTIGGDAPVSVQTMTKADPQDVGRILEEIREAEALGATLVRLAVPNEAALRPFAEVRKESPLPLVADIHFSHTLALGAIEAGADKIRINPGNLKNWDRIAEVVRAAREAGIAMRIGVNSGSIRSRDGDTARPLVDLMADELLSYAERIEDMGLTDLVLSVKAPDPATTLAANRAVAPRTDCPLHLGVTHAGPESSALLKSAIGVGGLLAEGIGDTIRISFTGPGAGEVRAGFAILRAAGRLREGVDLISCPTCGRCRTDLAALVRQAEDQLRAVQKPLSVAIMGCEVNGPGEARECDIGIAAGNGSFALFRRGTRIRSVPAEEALQALLDEIHIMEAEGR